MNKHYCWIKCKVNNYYKFINKVNRLNIRLEQIIYNDKTIYIKINESDYKKLKKYLISYNFYKYKELGIYKVKEIINKYKIYIISLILGLGLFLYVSNLIIDVKVIHEDKELRELILDELDTYGVKKLSLKKNYKTMQGIKEKILDKYPDKIDWLEFEIKGMNVYVRVEERIITKIEKDDRKCNIVARKEGMVSNIKLISGVVNVGLYENVKEGSVLISGIVTQNNNEVARVCAKGEVYANTWYKASVTIPFEHIEYKKTGRKKYNIIFSDGIKKNRLLKNRFNSFESSYKTILKVFDYRVLLEKEYETKRIVKKYNESEALELALKKAEDNVLKSLNAKDSIIDKKVLKKSINDSKIYVEVFVIANEQIGITSYIEEGIDNNDNTNN